VPTKDYERKSVTGRGGVVLPRAFHLDPNLNTTKKYLYSLKERRIRAVNILDQIERISTSISTGEGFGGKGNELSTEYNWWRCRDLNPGHCGYD
jgi:hypothetical protein